MATIPVGTDLGATEVRCTRCGFRIPVALTVTGTRVVTDEYGARAVKLQVQPDLADLYAHTWTHTHGEDAE